MYKELFGNEWYDLLKDYLYSKEFKEIGLTLRDQYALESVIPPKGSPIFFKAFKDLQPSKIKVVVLGQDPYPDITKYGMTYTGYAFDNANSVKLSASLRNIFKEIDRTYPDNEFNLDYGLDRWDLSRWVKQGVFLVNTALSVIESKPKSHTDLWKPFTIEWINRLNYSEDDIVWMLWGRDAESFSYLITNPSHYKIVTGHPSPLNRSNPFVGSGCFVECNEQLKGLGKREIIW